MGKSKLGASFFKLVVFRFFNLRAMFCNPSFAFTVVMTFLMLTTCVVGKTDEKGVAEVVKEKNDEKGVAEVMKEKNDDSKSGDSDQEMPSKKLQCHYRLYNWDNVTSMKVTCDSKTDKCAYVYIHYYNNENKRINMLSQHCNHHLSKKKMEEHCERMKATAKDAAATPFSSCEMVECNTNLCNTPYKRGMRPAYVVLIALTASTCTVVLFFCICFIISCCRGGSEASGGTNKNRGKGRNANSNKDKAEKRDENNNNNSAIGTIRIDVDSNNNNNNSEDAGESTDAGEENKSEEGASGPKKDFVLIQVLSEEGEKSHSSTPSSPCPTSRVSPKEDL